MNKWRMGLHSKQRKIWLDFPYDPKEKASTALKAKCQGVKWSKPDRLWTFPLDMDVARDIASVAKEFGVGLAVEPELVAWVKKEKARDSQVLAPDDLKADVSDLLPRCRQYYPQLITAMETKPWQIPGAAFTYAQRFVLNADEPGLGKTVQTLAAIAEADIRGPIIVIAPKSAVAVTWPDEIEQWLGPEIVIKINTEMDAIDRSAMIQAIKFRTETHPHERIWIVCGPNYLRIRADLDDYGNYLRDKRGKKLIYTLNEAVPELFDINWASIIVDESHQTLACAKGDRKKWSAQRLGLCSLPVSPGGFRIAMSGTPFRGKTENLWGTLNWLRPDRYTSIWNWNKRHYGVLDTRAIGGSAIVKGDEILDKQRFYNELKPIMVRRTKAEVAPWLPAKQYGGTHLDPNDKTSPVAVWLKLTTQQKKQYKDIVKDACLYLDVGEMTVNGTLAEMVRFKQLANSSLGSTIVKNKGWDINKAIPVFPSNKFDWIVDFIYQRQTAGTKVIVASQFTQFLNMASDKLTKMKIGHYLFTGDTPDSERVRIKREFQKTEGEMLVLLNTISGGTSLTLDAADDVIIVDQTWIPDDQTQLEDRAHRISRIHNVTIWNLASLDTIDEDIAILNNERSIETSVIDTQRDVVYVKRLVAMTKQRIERLT